ncbi:MAG: siderophore-interacting protein [Actinobacteria bacterium]|nr:siderophore-interacting protein [Actinomycetota bacterium]
MTSDTASVRVRPGYRPFIARVAMAQRLSPHFVRVTFTSADFAHFGTAGLDQRVKVILPLTDGSLCDIGQHDEASMDAGEWYTRWRALPPGRRNPFRTYTVRRIDPAARELEIDFVVHHDAGPAGAWADRAEIGDALVIVGPDQRSPESLLGLDWHPGSARRVLLAGDETAAPAISSILESLDGAFEADAFIEVPSAADTQELASGDGIRVHWLARGDRPHGQALIHALEEWVAASPDLLTRAAAPRRQELDDIDVDRDLLWDSPEAADGEFYAWIAGESGTVKTLRRMLVTGQGVDRKRVAFMGYWRLGQAERVE